MRPAIIIVWKHKVAILVLILMSIVARTESVYAVAEQDSLALVALYNSTDGPNWSHNDNWLVGPVETWYGVTVGPGLGLAPVTELYLRNNLLKGNIPAEIGNLTNLIDLRLEYNQLLTGNIPAEIGNLSNLQTLFLINNQLSGSIPAEIGNLSNLNNLNLGWNQLTGNIPAEIGNLSNLNNLNLMVNQLTGSIPAEIGNLLNLQDLSIGYNQLTGGIPAEIGNLLNLQDLFLRSNFLTDIPSEMGNLSNLNELVLRNNKLTTIPAEIGNLFNLQSLYLDNNLLTAIPSEIGNMTNLVRLELSYNQLTAIPSEIGNMTNLERLWINSNQLTDIPSEIGNLKSNPSLNLSNNQLSFSNIAATGILPGDLSYFNYSLQRNMSAPVLTQLGTDILLSIPAGHSDNLYQWYCNDEEISGATSNELIVAEETIGEYKCRITNQLYPELTLWTEGTILTGIPKTVILKSPNGTETWEASTIQNIIWTSDGIINVKLEYTTDNGTNWTTIVASAPASTGTYSWFVPIRPSENCMVRVSDASYESLNDISNAVFCITESTNETILYQSEKDYNTGCPAIWVMNPDGSNQTRLTNSLAYDILPSWSPDGSKIVFTSDRNGHTYDSREIYIMDADGSNPVRLTNNDTLDDYASWSPDGSKIAFLSTRDDNWEIYVMNADGSNPNRLTDNPHNDFNPSWSPDGLRIAFCTNRDGNMSIYVMDADGSNQTMLTDNSAKDYYPTWSPDGSQISFSSNREGFNQIFVMDADGSNQTRLTNNIEMGGHSWSSWSPDGSKLAYRATYNLGNLAIYVMNADGSNPTRITNNLANDDFPSWARPVYVAPIFQIMCVADAAAQGLIYSYCYNWDGYEYIPIHVTNDTTIQPWSGFWTIVNNANTISGFDLLIKKSDNPPVDVPSLTVQRSKHYLISTPLQTASTDLNASSLGQQLGNNLYEKTWRIGKWMWNTEGYHNYNGPDPQYDELMSLQPGKGFWFQHVNNHPMTITLEGTKVDPPSGYYEIKLPKNNLDVPYTYHMAGNPYWYPIKWADCMVRIPMTESLPTAKPAITMENLESWYIQLKLTSTDETTRDTYNRAGIVEQGDAAILRAIDMAPPGEYVRLSILDPMDSNPTQYAYDYRQGGVTEYTWKLELTTSYSAKDVLLSLENLEQVPDQYTFTLTDDRKGEIYTLDEDVGIGVTLTSGAAKTFTLTATTTPPVLVEDTLPVTFGITSVMPNPFNPVTTIAFNLEQAGDTQLRIFNINGQLIDTVHSGYMEAGNHSVVWNAADHASGVYFARIDIQDKYDVRKMLFMK